MRISEFSTDKALDVLCEITPFISDIVADEELLAEFRRAVDPKKAKTKGEQLLIGAEKLNKIVPIVLKKKKNAIFGIISVLNSKSPEEIARQNILMTMCEIRDIAKDKELIAFFKSCAKQERSE